MHIPRQAMVQLGLVTSILNPLPQGNLYNATEVAFVNRKALNALPYYFTRDYIGQLWGTVTESSEFNKALAKLGEAKFVAYDEQFVDVLGPNPTVEKLYDLPEDTHEAPNFLRKQNQVFVSNFNHSYEYLINLSTEPWTISNLTTDPTLESVNGGFPYKDKLIVGTDGFRNSTPPGLYIFDPATNESTVLLNNYHSLKFGTPDDLVVLGDQVWFVDAPYGYIAKAYSNPPELAPSIYCYDIVTGNLAVVDQSITWPNGIAFSPDNTTLYITETPLGPTNTTAPHAIYAFDVSPPHTLSNKRVVYVPDTYFADGLKVSEKGNLFTAAGSTIDVISPQGDLLGKISVPGAILNNLVFLPGGNMIITGVGAIWCVHIAEQGILPM